MAELVERGERPDVLFWVGCMGSFDDRAKKITVAFASILKACDIRFAILGQEEQLPRRSGAPDGQRVPLPDAGEETRSRRSTATT